jgi:predicted NAD-dependent protein-ADP-ribosyltransferase YbiA (DUF1768 family)
MAGGRAARKARKMVILSPAQLAVWDAQKKQVMQVLWKDKFTQNLAAKRILLATRQSQLWHIMPRAAPERWVGLEELRHQLSQTLTVRE